MKQAGATELTADARWRKVLARSVGANFFYGVRTTGIFCRPSCGARRPSRKNVRFFDSSAAAMLAGFRPCLRCGPNQNETVADDTHTQQVLAMLRFIEASQTPPKLNLIAAAAGLSPSHAHRIFRKAMSVTPKAYSAALRKSRLTQSPKESPSVIHAVFASGYGNAPGLYRDAKRTLGMVPSVYRNGAKDIEIKYAHCPCSLGHLLVATTPVGICSVLLGTKPSELVSDLRHRFPKANIAESRTALQQTLLAVVSAVERPDQSHAMPLDARGTVYQHRVWQALQNIPPGDTKTYSEIAAAIGQPKGARAVARACAENPIAVLIPCHRVINKKGSLSGYRWGPERKSELLRREQRSPRKNRRF